ncbi:hypothetical protein [Nocardia wallacei]|uniref:hypothetical protein n=1 Tax=Nocardia wallacei TaxID=480035 RepID=UPI0024547CDE|nr:hypothetical protein [Nocardia wallacei]
MSSPSRRSSTRAALPAASSAAPPRPGRTQVTIPTGHWYRPPPNPEFGGSGTLTALASPRATATFSGSGALASVGAPAATALLNGAGTLTAPGAPAAFTDFTGDGALSVVAAGSSTATFTSDALLASDGIPAPTAPFTADGATVGDAVPVTSVAFTGEGTFGAAEEQHYLAFLEGEGSLTVTAAPTATASFSGAGALTSAISPAAVAALSGSGTLAASGVASGTAGFSGSGELIVPTNAAEAALSGSGALSVSASPAIPVALSGAGSLAASGAPILTAAHSGAGTLAVSGAGVGTAALSGSGTLTASGYAMFVDDFNRANSTSIGSQWTETGGDLSITSNALACNTGSTTNNRRGAVYNTQTQTPYQSVEFSIAGTPNTVAGSGAILRCNSGMTQMVILSVASNGWNLGRITGINGTFTSIGSLSMTIANGDVIRVSCDSSSTYRVYVNGVRSGGPIVDTTWADSSHQFVGLFVQRGSTSPNWSAPVDNFKAWDTRDIVALASDDFNRASLGSAWTQASQNGGTMYLTSNEVCAVGLPSSPISVIYHDTLFTSDRQIARARVRWHSRNPEHSSMSVAVRANPATGHHGVHFWFTSTLMGIATYTTNLTSFTAATGTADYVSTSKFAEGALIEIRAEGTTYTASVDGVAVLQGTFTTTAVPLTNLYAAIHGEDDSAVSGGGEPPANLDDFATYIIP